LGELYQQINRRLSLADCFGKGTGPPEAALVASFNHCRLSALDKKVWHGKGWAFVKGKDGYPKLAVEGRLRHQLKDRQGRDFVVQVLAAKCQGTTTDYTKSPPQRLFNVSVSFRVSGTFGVFSATATWNLLPDECIRYDTEGQKAAD
jgi:hypothetical protein